MQLISAFHCYSFFSLLHLCYFVIWVTKMREKNITVEQTEYALLGSGSAWGAWPHCSNASLEYLHHCYPGDRVISLYGPPFSTPTSGSFSVGIPKSRTYANNTQTLMRSRITFEWRSGEFPMRCWTGSLQMSMLVLPQQFSAKKLGLRTWRTTELYSQNVGVRG